MSINGGHTLFPLSVPDVIIDALFQSVSQIIVASRELFNFSHGEPPEGFLTFHRVLHVGT
jgi:hypothetical protein